MKFKVFIFSMLTLLAVLPISAQRKPGGATQAYAAAEKKCDAAITARTWKSAEALCKNALSLPKNRPIEI